jgi:predicted phosphoadenosine phosphosulfate sulfurtransferase
VKVYEDRNVYTSAVERLEQVFASFEKVYFSVSFGKDSSVMLHLALEVAARMGRLPVNVLYIDLEGQYQATIAHAVEMMNHHGVVGHWVCVPLTLRNAVSMHQPFWRCWDPEEREKWIRPMPEHPSVVSDPSFFPFYRQSMEFEEFVEEYGEWFAGGERTACMVGIRADESLNRYRTIASTSKTRFNGLAWTTKVSPSVFNAYPIYDWRTEDIWTAVGKFGWTYNRVYDAMQMAGVPLSQQRICQPYGDDQRRGLDLYHRCEPGTWPKVVARVTGANFGARYSKSALSGYRKMIKPPEFTWRQYTEFLLSTLPKFQAEWYRRKFTRFWWWWKEHRGVEMEDAPDFADPALEAGRKVPSWRRLARVVLTNDLIGRSISFSQTKRQWQKYQELRAEFGE